MNDALSGRTSDSLPSLGQLRRRLLVESLAVAIAPLALGATFGAAARVSGLSLAESTAMSVLVAAGAAQFAALALITHGSPLLAIAVTTAMINLRNVVYALALTPWLRRVPLWQRAAMAHFLNDVTFALSVAHFQRLGRVDVAGYWVSGVTLAGWITGTAVGFLAAGSLAGATALGLDAVFPSAMAALALVLTETPSARVAASLAAVAAVVLGLLLPFGLAIVLAAGAGLVGGVVAARHWDGF